MASPYRKVNEAKGLPLGSTVSSFEAIDQYGSKYSLDEALKNGPVVLIFYRGFWCPFCNKHLKELQNGLEKIYEKGASVVTVSPEKPEFLVKMTDKTGAKFTLLNDEGYKISDAFDVTFKPESGELIMYNVVLRAKLKKTQSDESERLPIPATFIIGQDRKIVWRQFDPNYKKRSSVADILSALEK